MGYIKCVIKSRFTDEEGRPKVISIGSLESDMADINLFELPILMHAFAIKGLVEIVKSCFGAGYWVNEKPWLNDEAWSNKV